MPGHNFPQDQQQPHRAQQNGNVGRRPEDRRGLLFPQQAGNGAGNGGYNEKNQQLALWPVIPGGRDKGLKHIQPVLVKVGHQRQQRAHMQENVETQATPRHAQIVFQKGQMA